MDARTVGLYLDLPEFIDLDQQAITAASLSDVLRILLLHEYGGVWVDATLLCNQPLDTWLPSACGTGFFAFAAPAPGRLLASWFLACAPNNRLVAKWAAKALRYWNCRTRSDDYFWFHHQFDELCAIDPEARAAWECVPRITADGPHALQAGGLMYQPASTAGGQIDWTIPVFKLTHRVDADLYQPGCLLHHLLHRFELPDGAACGTRAGVRLSAKNVLRTMWHRFKGSADVRPITQGGHSRPARFAGLSVSTENLGDHIQIIAANRLLDRLGVVPEFLVDRDDEVASLARLNELQEPAAIVLNGGFNTNPAEWPPHPNLSPLYLDFHIRLSQSPTLLSEEALRHYRQHGPIGCGDNYTLALLQNRGVDAFLSNCLSLALPNRIQDDDRQIEVFVVSRDERILDYVPDHLKPFTFINQYSGSSEFAANMRRASDLLDIYRSRARLVVTTLLHCALPAIAMGIPVVVFYPLNSDTAHSSDRERFSALETMIRVFELCEAGSVDWRGRVVDVSQIKIALLDAFYTMATRWRTPVRRPLGPIASPDSLPGAPSVRIRQVMPNSGGRPGRRVCTKRQHTHSQTLTEGALARLYSHACQPGSPGCG